MKYIRKGVSPHELRQWIVGQTDAEGRRTNCDYENNMPTVVKNAVKQCLILEQGHLCCYTGIRITLENSHIEHLKPQSQCIKGEEDVDYNNMLAAYPKKKHGEPECPFGADIRHNWYDLPLFVHPLYEQCEARFRFNLKGDVHPARDNDEAAKTTIEKLSLNHKRLRDMRETAIDELFFDDDAPISSPAKLRALIKKGYSHKDAQEKYPPFCFVIDSVAPEVLQRVKREQKRKQAIRKQTRQ